MLDVAAEVAWSHPDPDPEFFATVVGSLPGVVRPHVVQVARPGREPLVIVARLEDIRLETKAGYRTVLRPRLRCLTVVNGGVEGVETAEDAREPTLALLRSDAFSGGEADVVRFLGPGRLAPVPRRPRRSRRGCAATTPRCPQPHWRVVRARHAGGLPRQRARATRGRT